MLKSFLLFLLFSATVAATCPKESFLWQSSCFFYRNQSLGFADAEFDCVSLGGHLSSIHNGFTNALLAQKGQLYFYESTVTDFWIGLTNLESPGNWTWMDGTNLDFVDWAPGEPQKNTGLNCATLSLTNGYWNNEGCFKQKPYFCEVDEKVFDPITTPSYSSTKYYNFANCSFPFAYLAATHSCYGSKNWTGFIDWTTAEQFCESWGGHLASIHSYEELAFIKSMVFVGNSDLWIGGFSNDGEKTWKWSDGTLWDFISWFPGYPKRNANSCLGISNAGMYDRDCKTADVRLICKIKL